MPLIPPQHLQEQFISTIRNDTAMKSNMHKRNKRNVTRQRIHNMVGFRQN